MAGRIPAPPPEGLEIRHYRDEDESRVLEVLQRAFGAWPVSMPAIDPVEFFRWKHLECPWGKSLMVVADCGEGAVGFGGWMPYRLALGDRLVLARRGADLSVLPEHHGRGIASRLVEAATRHIPEAALTFSNTNERSTSAVLRLGRRRVGGISRYVRPCRPAHLVHARIARRAGSDALPLPPVAAEAAAGAFADRDAVASLLERVRRPQGRFAIAKDADYLRWRYGALDGYHAVREEGHGGLRGLVCFRVVRDQGLVSAKICELLVEPGDRRVARALLGRAVAASSADYAVCSFPRGSAELRAAIGSGFVPYRNAGPLLVYPIATDLEPDPTALRSWALTHGDVELL